MPPFRTLAYLLLNVAAARHTMETQAPVAHQGEFVAPQYFDQRLDHFDGTNPGNWSQAFYVNDTFWAGPNSGAPVFLCVGGEGPAFDGSVVQSSVHCNNAVEWLGETKALMFAVQHRYYGCHPEQGKSNLVDCPVDVFTGTKDLKYLSSRQALADLANFHAFAMAKYELPADTKWVSFGGSYPGMLAAWVRLKFPHLIHAAVSSSSPVHAKVEMTEYNDIAADAYSVQSVGGSKACTAAISKGHTDIGALMNTAAGRASLAKVFDLSPAMAKSLAERANQRDFAGEGVAYFPSQGNDPSSTQPVSNIRLICEVMTNTTAGDEVSRLAIVRRAQIAAGLYQHEPSNDDMPDFWGYQTCAEFAFYQTCDVGSKCMYTQGLDLLADEESFCVTEFGVSPSLVAENVAQSNTYYGSDHPAGSRVLWVNGEVDPWHGLSVLKSLGPDMPALWVPGASHHAWTHPSADCVQDTVIKARAQIRAQVSKWLAVAK